MLRFFILIILSQASKCNKNKAQIQFDVTNNKYNGYWICKIQDCSNIAGQLYSEISLSTFEFLVLNDKEEIFIIGEIYLENQPYVLEQLDLYLFQNAETKYVFRAISVYQTKYKKENTFNPDDYITQNALYCCISSFLLLYCIIVLSLFVFVSSKLNDQEIYGSAVTYSLLHLLQTIGIIVIACIKSQGYRSYFIIPILLYGLNFIILGRIHQAFKDFCNNYDFDFIEDFCWLIFCTGQILLIAFSNVVLGFPDNEDSIEIPLVTQICLIYQLLPLFEQIRRNMIKGFSQEENYQNMPFFFYLYLFFISIPSIFSINFLAYYYKLFQFEPAYQLLEIHTTLFIVFEIIIILQHLYGPFFLKCKEKCQCICYIFKKRQKKTIIATQSTYRLLMHVYDVIENCIICNISLQPQSQQAQLLRQVIETPCGHVFHQDCLIAWKIKYGKCPICNQQLPTVVIVIE